MMASDNLYLPDDLIEEMEKHPEVNWEEVLKNSVRSHLEELTKDRLRKGWKEDFIKQFCGVIKGDVDEINNPKEIWIPKLD